MKFYSEILNKTFDTAADCVAAEKEHEDVMLKAKIEEEQKAAEKNSRMAAVEAARLHLDEVRNRCAKEIEEAQQNFVKLRTDYVKDYGYYHYSSKDIKDIPTLFNSLFGIL